MNGSQLFSLSACLLFACSSSEVTTESVDEGESLRSRSSAKLTIPVAELSALALRLDASGEQELLAAADSSASVYRASLQGGVFGAFTKIDLSAARAAAGVRGATQWEAMASDGQGRIFLLEENPGRIFVFDREGSAVEHVITLSIPTHHPLARYWAASPNSRGEGMLLLRNGHVLVLKEKDPRSLIEFGPSGEAPTGLTPALAVGTSKSFPLPAGASSTYIPLNEWTLGKPNKLPDVSDMSLAPDGGIYVLSDQGKAIGIVDSDGIDPRRAEVKFSDVVSLPSGVGKPEGLVVLGAGGALVATDSSARDNLRVVGW